MNNNKTCVTQFDPEMHESAVGPGFRSGVSGNGAKRVPRPLFPVPRAFFRGKNRVAINTDYWQRPETLNSDGDCRDSKGYIVVFRRFKTRGKKIFPQIPIPLRFHAWYWVLSAKFRAKATRHDVLLQNYAFTDSRNDVIARHASLLGFLCRSSLQHGSRQGRDNFFDTVKTNW